MTNQVRRMTAADSPHHPDQILHIYIKLSYDLLFERLFRSIKFVSITSYYKLSHGILFRRLFKSIKFV